MWDFGARADPLAASISLLCTPVRACWLGAGRRQAIRGSFSTRRWTRPRAWSWALYPSLQRSRQGSQPTPATGRVSHTARAAVRCLARFAGPSARPRLYAPCLSSCVLSVLTRSAKALATSVQLLRDTFTSWQTGRLPLPTSICLMVQSGRACAASHPCARMCLAPSCMQVPVTRDLGNKPVCQLTQAHRELRHCKALARKANIRHPCRPVRLELRRQTARHCT